MAKPKHSKTLALNKEPFRLWYEFLKRAKAKGMKVSKDYIEWGDTSLLFNKWWQVHGANLVPIVATGVALASDETMHDDNYYLFAIPKNLSPRQTRVEAEHLMKKLKAEHGEVKLNARWRLTEGSKAKYDSIRAYLHAIDCKDKLIKQAVAAGKSADDVKVVDVLAALRLYYIKKHERYKGKGDAMPYRLTHGDGGYETDPKKIIVSDHSDPKNATDSINAVRDYLKRGEALMQTVAAGSFPT